MVVVLATASTSSARFSAQTDNQSNLFQAATMELTVDSGRQLFLDGTGLYPGLELENCIVVTYRGSLDDIDVRLSATRTAGTLDRFFDLDLEIGTGSLTDCSDFRTRGSLFSGTLADLEARHASYPTGLILAASISDGATVTVRASGRLQDTNDAQGVAGQFLATVEARQASGGTP